MILAITLLVLAVAAYSISQLQQHGKLAQDDYNTMGKSTFWGYFSWTRKYKNYDRGDLRPKFFGSTTFLSFLTDGYHLMQSCSFLCLSLSFGFLMSNHYYSLGAWAIIHTVHYLTYKLLSR